MVYPQQMDRVVDDERFKTQTINKEDLFSLTVSIPDYRSSPRSIKQRNAIVNNNSWSHSTDILHDHEITSLQGNHGSCVMMCVQQLDTDIVKSRVESQEDSSTKSKFQEEGDLL